MALPSSLALQSPPTPPLSPTLICRLSSSNTAGTTQKPPLLQGHTTTITTRRTAALAALTTAFLAGEAIFLNAAAAGSFEWGFVAPDQTPEDAYAGVRTHARGLLGLGPLVDSRAWRALQLALRETSSYLKQDLYTIIQARPVSQRPLLRKLYSTLFNNATRLDYAARNEDASLVQECYHNIVVTLDGILERIYS